MITPEKVNRIALDYALEQVFTNVGDEDWPDNPILFLQTCEDEDYKTPRGEMIPLEVYENHSADELLELVGDLQDAFKYAINGALSIERSGK